MEGTTPETGNTVQVFKVIAFLLNDNMWNIYMINQTHVDDIYYILYREHV